MQNSAPARRHRPALLVPSPGPPMLPKTIRLAAALALGFTAPPALAQRVLPPQPCVLLDVRLVDSPDAPHKSIVLRDGRIEAVLDDPQASVPGARRIDGGGLLALPAFIDAYTGTGCETPTPAADRDRPAPENANVHIDMREANRKGIQPAFRAADALAFEKKDRDAWWESGFAVVHVAPTGQLLSGESVVATTRDAAARDVIVRAAPFAAASFRSGGGGYPSTLMGGLAQLRQFFRDVRHHRLLSQRRREGRPGPRPAYDADLDRGSLVLAGTRPLLAFAQDSHDVERWLALAVELELPSPPVLVGGRDAWQVAGRLAEGGVPLLLTLDWGEEVDDPDAKQEPAQSGEPDAAEPPAEGESPEAQVVQGEQDVAEPGIEVTAAPEAESEPVWEYEEPLGVRRERRRLWVERRDNALRLAEAGVPIAFGGAEHGPKKLLEHVRDLVEAGLPRDVALAGLTTTSARILGLDGEVGRVAPGYGAHIAVWTRSPLDEKAELRWLVVDGEVHEFEAKESAQGGEPAEGVDPGGTWTVTFDSEDQTDPATVVLEMAEDGSVTGHLSFYSRFAEQEVAGELEGGVDGRTLRLESTLSVSGFEIQIELEGELEGDEMNGETTWRFSEGEQTTAFTAVREPQRGGDGR